VTSYYPILVLFVHTKLVWGTTHTVGMHILSDVRNGFILVRNKVASSHCSLQINAKAYMAFNSPWVQDSICLVCMCKIHFITLSCLFR
jgi:hypothetical protein